MSSYLGFELIKDPTGLPYYGNMPDTPVEPDDSYELYKIDWDDARALDEDFADPINDLCDSLIGLYDVDYFDAKQCLKLRAWLVERLKRPCTGRLRELYTVLLDYANRAIELGTGVVVEL